MVNLAQNRYGRFDLAPSFSRPGLAAYLDADTKALADVGGSGRRYPDGAIVLVSPTPIFLMLLMGCSSRPTRIRWTFLVFSAVLMMGDGRGRDCHRRFPAGG